jgi:hypothetical protein
MVRSERRRQAREQEAAQMNLLNQDTDDTHLWQQIAPLLDDAISHLNSKDRDALLLRFFERRDIRAIGEAVGISEVAAQKRVSRALERLRTLLVKRGITLTAAALGTALTSHAVMAAPIGLAVGITGTAIAGAAANTGLTLTLMKIMTIGKIKIGLATAVAVVGLGTPLAIQYQENSLLKQQNRILKTQADQAAADQAKYDELRLQQNTSLQELVRLRKEHDELLKLRGEVGPLRRKLADLEKQQGIKQAAAPAAPVAVDPSDEPLDPVMEAFKQQAILRMNTAKNLVLGFHQYANDNQGNLPKSFAEILPYLDDDMKNSDAQDRFEILYQGKISDIKSPANTILVRESQAMNGPSGNWVRTYGFMDGHSEVHSEATEDFSQWERSRLPGANMN